MYSAPGMWDDDETEARRMIDGPMGDAERQQDEHDVEAWLRKRLRYDYQHAMAAFDHRLSDYVLNGPSSALNALYTAAPGDDPLDAAGQAAFDTWVRDDLERHRPGRNLLGIIAEREREEWLYGDGTDRDPRDADHEVWVAFCAGRASTYDADPRAAFEHWRETRAPERTPDCAWCRAALPHACVNDPRLDDDAAGRYRAMTGMDDDLDVRAARARRNAEATPYADADLIEAAGFTRATVRPGLDAFTHPSMRPDRVLIGDRRLFADAIRTFIASRPSEAPPRRPWRIDHEERLAITVDRPASFDCEHISLSRDEHEAKFCIDCGYKGPDLDDEPEVPTGSMPYDRVPGCDVCDVFGSAHYVLDHQHAAAHPHWVVLHYPRNLVFGPFPDYRQSDQWIRDHVPESPESTDPERPFGMRPKATIEFRTTAPPEDVTVYFPDMIGLVLSLPDGGCGRSARHQPHPFDSWSIWCTGGTQ